MPGKAPNTEPPAWLAARGMTLRDYFAGQSLAASTDVLLAYDGSNAPLFFRDIATAAYMVADAMLAARSKL